MNCFVRSAIALLCTGLFASAHAVDLIAVGQLDGAGSDLSGLTDTLENGVRHDLIGGIGSGLAWAGGTTFLALPDRGPNATAWNSAVDDTASYIPRFHTLDLSLVPATSGSLPYELKVTLQRTTLLFAPQPLVYGEVTPAANKPSRHYFSGRSDNFDATKPSTNPWNARLDPEGIRVSRTGRTVYISDEYGPYVYQFDRATGARGRTYAMPDNLAVSYLSAHGKDEISGNASGRVANKGMEGLAISPDGKTLFGFVQSPLIQDGGDGGRANRIIKIDVASGKTQQFAYDNYIDDKAKAYNSSEIIALNSHTLLVLERDGKGLGDDSKAAVKRLYKVDLAGAEDVSALSGEAALLAKAPTKTLFLDIRAKLNAAGIADAQIPAKLEGLAFGQDIVVDGVTKHTLYVANDNDFLATTEAGLSNPNQWYVFTFTDADLGGSTFENQLIAR